MTIYMEIEKFLPNITIFECKSTRNELKIPNATQCVSLWLENTFWTGPRVDWNVVVHDFHDHNLKIVTSIAAGEFIIFVSFFSNRIIDVKLWKKNCLLNFRFSIITFTRPMNKIAFLQSLIQKWIWIVEQNCTRIAFLT